MRSITLLLVLLVACADQATTPTWEAFRSSAIDPSGGFVLDGDEPIRDEAELRATYDALIGRTQAALTVNRTGSNTDDVWSGALALNLTYCIDTASFGSQASTVVAAINAAAVEWEQAAKVNFVYASQYNASCNVNNTSVVFNVRKVPNNGEYSARAFYPLFPRNLRELVITDSAASSGSVALTGLMRHELGHTLGFRHETVRVYGITAPCGEDIQGLGWRALTATVDTASVMYAPHTAACGYTGPSIFTLTAADRAGAASLYGTPSCGDQYCTGNEGWSSCPGDCCLGGSYYVNGAYRGPIGLSNPIGPAGGLVDLVMMCPQASYTWTLLSGSCSGFNSGSHAASQTCSTTSGFAIRFAVGGATTTSNSFIPR